MLDKCVKISYYNLNDFEWSVEMPPCENYQSKKVGKNLGIDPGSFSLR